MQRNAVNKRKVSRSLSCRGIALLLTLGILLLLTLLALSFSSSQLTENQAARNFHLGAKAEEVALGGLETAIGVLREDANDNSYDHLFERWAIYYEGDDGFAAGDSASDSEAADLSDYDELAYGIDETGNLNLSGAKDPWQDEPVLDSRWIKVLALDPVTGQERLVGRFAVCIEDENAKANINTAGNPTRFDPSGRWTHRQNMGFSTAEVDLGNILDELGQLFEVTLRDVKDYPYNVESRTALDIVACRYGFDGRIPLGEVAPGRNNFDDNPLPQGRRPNDLLPQDKNGIDDDGDLQIDEPGEEKDEPGEFNPYEPCEIRPPGELLVSSNPSTGVMGDDTPYLTVSHAKMASSVSNRGGPSIKEMSEPDLPYPADRIYRALQPYLTVYGEDLNRFTERDLDNGTASRRAGGRTSRSQVPWFVRENVGRWLKGGPSEIEKSLGEFGIRFRDADILKQAAVNIYDFIDPDWFPTPYGDNVFGIEPTVYLNEVDSAPPDVPGSVIGIEGSVLDWGEWIELWNPYDIAIDVSRYRVTVDATSDGPGEGRQIGPMAVRPTIVPPHGFFVIGDTRGYVLNTGGRGPAGEQLSLGPRPPNCDAYAPLKLDAPLRMVLEMHTGGQGIRVIEAHSNIPTGSKNFVTAQKYDPRVPQWNVTGQTWRTWNAGQVNRNADFYMPGLRSHAVDPRFNPTDAGILEHAGALGTIGELGMVHRGEAWRSLNFTGQPQVGYPDSDSVNDLRLLDVLTLPYPYRHDGLTNDPELERDKDWPPPKVVPGRINVNTASPQVLVGLNWDGMIEELENYGLRVSLALRRAMIQHIIDRRRDKPYRNLADVAQDFAEFMGRYQALGNAPEGAREAFMRYNSNLITIRSSVFKVTVLAQVFDRRGNVAAARKLEAVVDRGCTPGSLGRPGENTPTQAERARAETARTLYFRWIAED